MPENMIWGMQIIEDLDYKEFLFKSNKNLNN